ncbi:MAG: GNAT family N-acetyltransferase [Actinobacteria bacterium]|nr:MAG: GNAT family N-acetyltransferase [Actinomycetota bacterium]
MNPLRGEKVRLRPLVEGDVPILRAIHARPEVAAWWGPVPRDFPADDPNATRFAIVLDERVVGLTQFTEESDPDYRHAWIDIFLDPEHHNQGLGADAIRTLVGHLIADGGHHRVTIDPATDNAAAIRCYEKAGFRPVGVTRLAWRDAAGRWRDALLMELVEPPDEADEADEAS